MAIFRWPLTGDIQMITDETVLTDDDENFAKSIASLLLPELDQNTFFKQKFPYLSDDTHQKSFILINLGRSINFNFDETVSIFNEGNMLAVERAKKIETELNNLSNEYILQCTSSFKSMISCGTKFQFAMISTDTKCHFCALNNSSFECTIDSFLNNIQYKFKLCENCTNICNIICAPQAFLEKCKEIANVYINSPQTQIEPIMSEKIKKSFRILATYQRYKAKLKI